MLKLIKITDNGGKTLDRYTAYFKGDGRLDGDYMLMMSHNCLSSQGVNISDTTKPEFIKNDTGAVVSLMECPGDVKMAIEQFKTEVHSIYPLSD